MVNFEELEEKSHWVRKETLKLHKLAPGTRIASSLSDVEIFVVLYYGKILDYDPKNIFWEQRNRFIISKGHGSVSMYPILADLGFFDKKELDKISTEESFLGNIPDTGIPGYETINGSVGHGLGIACGIALAMKLKKINKKVFVICGDGEINEGSVWEAIMFASFHHLDNLVLIVDDNKMSMLGYQKDILCLNPLKQKFQAFNWNVECVDGHDVKQLYTVLHNLKHDTAHDRPTVVLADTIKGKGVPELENDVLSHVRILTEEEIDRRLATWD
jgi:transketolase